MVSPKSLSRNTPSWRAGRCRCRSGRRSWTCRRCCRRTWTWRRCRLARGASEQIIQHRTLVFAPAFHALIVLVLHNNDVRVAWQVLIRGLTGKVARNRIGHTGHHRIGRIDNGIARTQVETRPAAKRQGITAVLAVAVPALNGTLYPHHTAARNVGFQRRDGCGVVRKEIAEEVVVPVKDDHPILREVEPSQVSWHKHSKVMPGSSNGIFNNG